MQRTDPGQAVALLQPTVSGSYSCYAVPSAYYVPGTIVRIEADPNTKTAPKAGAQPIASFGSPVATYQSKPFVEEWTVEWKDSTLDANAKVTLLSKYFQALSADSEVKLKATRDLTLKASMKKVKELLLFDDAGRTVRTAIEANRDDLQPNFLYYWIKSALMPEEVSYSATPTSGAEFSVDLKPKAAPVELTVKSGAGGAGTFKAQGVINCIHPERISITAKDNFAGKPDIQVQFHETAPHEAILIAPSPRS